MYMNPINLQYCFGKIVKWKKICTQNWTVRIELCFVFSNSYYPETALICMGESDIGDKKRLTYSFTCKYKIDRKKYVWKQGLDIKGSCILGKDTDLKFSL